MRVSRCIVERFDGRQSMGLEEMPLCETCRPEGTHFTRLKIKRRKPPQKGLRCRGCGHVGDEGED